MPDPFLGCCKIWYGTNRICYDFVRRETWHPEFSFQKLKSKKFLNDYEIPTKAIWHDYSHTNLSSYATCLIIELCQNFYDLSRDYSHAPMIKTHVHPQIIADSYTESHAQHAPFRPQKFCSYTGGRTKRHNDRKILHALHYNDLPIYVSKRYG